MRRTASFFCLGHRGPGSTLDCAYYPEAEIVVAGHGPMGSLQALVHTIDLLRARAAAVP